MSFPTTTLLIYPLYQWRAAVTSGCTHLAGVPSGVYNMSMGTLMMSTVTWPLLMKDRLRYKEIKFLLALIGTGESTQCKIDFGDA